jgi:hypothetical protein
MPIAPFEARLRAIARASAFEAVNRAVTWQIHPTYDTKTAVREAFRRADSLLLAIAEADGEPGAGKVCGVSRKALQEAASLVAAHRPDDPSLVSLLCSLEGEMNVGHHSSPTAR